MKFTSTFFLSKILCTVEKITYSNTYIIEINAGVLKEASIEPCETALTGNYEIDSKKLIALERTLNVYFGMVKDIDYHTKKFAELNGEKRYFVETVQSLPIQVWKIEKVKKQKEYMDQQLKMEKDNRLDMRKNDINLFLEDYISYSFYIRFYNWYVSRSSSIELVDQISKVKKERIRKKSSARYYKIKGQNNLSEKYINILNNVENTYKNILKSFVDFGIDSNFVLDVNYFLREYEKIKTTTTEIIYECQHKLIYKSGVKELVQASNKLMDKFYLQMHRCQNYRRAVENKYNRKFEANRVFISSKVFDRITGIYTLPNDYKSKLSRFFSISMPQYSSIMMSPCPIQVENNKLESSKRKAYENVPVGIKILNTPDTNIDGLYETIPTYFLDCKKMKMDSSKMSSDLERTFPEIITHDSGYGTSSSDSTQQLHQIQYSSAYQPAYDI